MILLNDQPPEHGARYLNECKLHVDNLFELSWQQLQGLQILLEDVKNRRDKVISFNGECLK